MQKTRTSLVVLALSLGVASLAGAVYWKKTAGETMVESAKAFLGSLDAKQKQTALMSYEAKERLGWHFIPKPTRKGLVIRDMNPAQKAAALRLLRAALSEAGYDKSTRIMLLEGVLLELEGPGSKGKRDPEKYYVTLFGEPDDHATWGFSYEGHHLSLNFVVANGKIVDSTPQFLAANPATVMNATSGPIKQGTRVLRDEEQLGFDLVNKLDKEQAAKAVLGTKARKEIGGAGEAQAPKTDLEGIAFSDLGTSQQKLLKELIGVYVGSMPASVAAQRYEILDRDGWDGIHFAWEGALKPGIGHYYRIQGKSFVVEFVNTQPDPAGNPANHIHCVWRDLTGDFNLAAE